MKTLEEYWEYFLNIASKKDIDAITNEVLDDVLVCLNGNVFRGKETYRNLVSNAWKNSPSGTYTWKNDKVETSKDGTLGYIFGEHSFISQGKVVGTTLHLYVWKKHNDQWKMAAVHGVTPAQK